MNHPAKPAPINAILGGKYFKLNKVVFVKNPLFSNPGIFGIAMIDWLID